jgi:phosphoribosylformimino-5-aminoimidazole carboxamide ribonucleotide (ProFAR) isomerase
MAHDITALERAFQLASSGGCASVKVIRQRLKAEGYSTGQITGRTLYRQLVALIKATQKEKPCAQGTVL